MGFFLSSNIEILDIFSLIMSKLDLRLEILCFPLREDPGEILVSFLLPLVGVREELSLDLLFEPARG